MSEFTIHIQVLRSIAMEMYIKSTEGEYGLEHKDLDNMSDEELMNYLNFLDELHDK